jgi:ADP-heptose:LPS heptosyltransferase
MSLEVLTPFLENEHIEFFSLQKEYRSADQISMKALQGKIQDYSDMLNDFSDTAALIEKMDVVVCVDTSIAHLAGAMGKPVMLMLPHTPDFRWLIDRQDSPWYPTMHIFRQSSPANWTDVIKEIDGVLKSLF